MSAYSIIGKNYGAVSKIKLVINDESFGWRVGEVKKLFQYLTCCDREKAAARMQVRLNLFLDLLVRYFFSYCTVLKSNLLYGVLDQQKHIQELFKVEGCKK